VRAFFDTSILVPVFYGEHVHHEASLALFIQFDKSTGCCEAHSLVEVFSTLTRMPGKHRISGAQAMLFVGSICQRLSLVALEGNEYAKSVGDRGVSWRGGRRNLRRHSCPLRFESRGGDDLQLEYSALCPMGPGDHAALANALGT
jgi:hypothetical protein